MAITRLRTEYLTLEKKSPSREMTNAKLATKDEGLAAALHVELPDLDHV